jgi:hypothetical protein
MPNEKQQQQQKKKTGRSTLGFDLILEAKDGMH